MPYSTRYLLIYNYVLFNLHLCLISLEVDFLKSTFNFHQYEIEFLKFKNELHLYQIEYHSSEIELPNAESEFQ